MLCFTRGSCANIKLPFQLRISHFDQRRGIPALWCAIYKKCFVFEAYDGEASNGDALRIERVRPWEDFNHSEPGMPDVKYFGVATSIHIHSLSHSSDGPSRCAPTPCQLIARRVSWKAMHAPPGIRVHLRHRPPALAGLEPKLVYLTLGVPRRPRLEDDALVRREPI